tara:strand:+ start:187 stop:330 length:144 start_codon:yes stop_codon:yes gene_type:complete
MYPDAIEIEEHIIIRNKFKSRITSIKFFSLKIKMEVKYWAITISKIL